MMSRPFASAQSKNAIVRWPSGEHRRDLHPFPCFPALHRIVYGGKRCTEKSPYIFSSFEERKKKKQGNLVSDSHRTKYHLDVAE